MGRSLDLNNSGKEGALGRLPPPEAPRIRALKKSQIKSEPSPSNPAAHRRRLVHGALRTLPSRQRQAMGLHYKADNACHDETNAAPPPQPTPPIVASNRI